MEKYNLPVLAVAFDQLADRQHIVRYFPLLGELERLWRRINAYPEELLKADHAQLKIMGGCSLLEIAKNPQFQRSFANKIIEEVDLEDMIINIRYQ